MKITAIALLLLLPASALTAGDAAEPAPEVTETEIVRYEPPRIWPDELDFRPGRCWTTSLVMPRGDAFRCSTGNLIYDPCFPLEGGEYVIAGADPSTGDPGFLIKLTEPLPEPGDYTEPHDYVWMIELADGTVAARLSGATGIVGEKTIKFILSGYDGGDLVAIIGELNPGKVWTAEKATLDMDEDGFYAVESELVPIRTIWR